MTENMIGAIKYALETIQPKYKIGDVVLFENHWATQLRQGVIVGVMPDSNFKSPAVRLHKEDNKITSDLAWNYHVQLENNTSVIVKETHITTEDKVDEYIDQKANERAEQTRETLEQSINEK